MLFRQKLAFFVLGCVFVSVGQVVTGMVVPSANAQGGLQDAEFNEVTVRKLNVTDDSGSVVELHVTRKYEIPTLHVSALEAHRIDTRMIDVDAVATVKGRLQVWDRDGSRINIGGYNPR